jgi:hypothetical protein
MSRPSRRTRARGVALPRCVFDSGGLTALVGGSQRAREWLRWILDHEGAICVPTPVLVECTTGDGGRDAEVNRVLGVLQRAARVLQPPDESIARCAGRLRFLARSDDGIDALVHRRRVGINNGGQGRASCGVGYCGAARMADTWKIRCRYVRLAGRRRNPACSTQSIRPHPVTVSWHGLHLDGGALVAAAAVGDGSAAVVLTSDPDDLGRLLQEEPQVSVRPV